MRAHTTAIAGGPRTGKTTLGRALAQALGVSLRSTDSLIETVSFADAPRSVAQWIAEPGPWIIEGVQVARALRHWLRDNAEGIPCERVFWSESPKAEQSHGQVIMAKGIRTVWTQIFEELQTRGVVVQRF
jgi:hypothetical protein